MAREPNEYSAATVGQRYAISSREPNAGMVRSAYTIQQVVLLHMVDCLLMKAGCFSKRNQKALRYLYVGSDHFKPVFSSRGLVVGFDVESIPGASRLGAFRYGRFTSKAKCRIPCAAPMIRRLPSPAEIYRGTPFHIPRQLDMT